MTTREIFGTDTTMTQLLKITSVKQTEEFTGPESDAITRAVELNRELQPAFGVQIENEDGDTIFDTEA